MKYKISFYGRRVNAIGILSGHTRTVEATDRDAAILKLYDTHEHISVISVHEVGAVKNQEVRS